MVTISNVADKPVTRGFCTGNTLGVVTLGPLIMPLEAGQERMVDGMVQNLTALH